MKTVVRKLISNPKSFRFMPTSLAFPVKMQAVRFYFTLDPLESDADSGFGPLDADMPKAVKVGGRYTSSLGSGTKKSVSDVINWLWTSKQNRLALPSYKYHETSYIKIADVDYEKIRSRSGTKLSWV
jgi:hypothetical protein